MRCFSKNPKIGLYAGSFDPPSSGHLDIIERGLNVCDQLIVGVAINPLKRPIFSFEERKRLLEQITENHQDKIKVDRVEGLLADYITDNKIDFQIRGIRSYADFDSEFTMGLINRELCNKETIFLLASSERVHISSSRIRELAMFNRKLNNFVPESIEEEVYSRLFEHYKDLPTFWMKDHKENNLKTEK